jgi:hypothetical protein
MVADPVVSRKIWKPSAERLIASADYVIFNDRAEGERRASLLEEIESLRGSMNGLILVSHPHEVISHPEVIQSLTACSLSSNSIQT